MEVWKRKDFFFLLESYYITCTHRLHRKMRYFSHNTHTVCVCVCVFVCDRQTFLNKNEWLGEKNCQKWDSNPRPHSWTRTLIPLLGKNIFLESGALDRSAILTYFKYHISHALIVGKLKSKLWNKLHKGHQKNWRCQGLYSGPLP